MWSLRTPRGGVSWLHGKEMVYRCTNSAQVCTKIQLMCVNYVNQIQKRRRIRICASRLVVWPEIQTSVNSSELYPVPGTRRVRGMYNPKRNKMKENYFYFVDEFVTV